MAKQKPLTTMSLKVHSIFSTYSGSLPESPLQQLNAQGRGEENHEVWDKFYQAMCDDIKRERKRSEGKNFVVTQAVYTRFISHIQPIEILLYTKC